MARCDELARVSAARDGIERVYLSPEHARVNRLAAEWMREIGMTTQAGCRGQPARPARRRRARPDAPALLLGSHLDTVPDAGRYDGIVGVLMALEVVRLLRVPGDDGGWRSPFPFALEVDRVLGRGGHPVRQGAPRLVGRRRRVGRRLVDADGCRRHDGPRGLPRLRTRPRSHRRGRPAPGRARGVPRGAHRAGARSSTGAASRSRSCRRSRVRGASSCIVEGEARHAGGTPYDMRRDALLGASRGRARRRAHLPGRAPHHRHRRAARGVPRRGQHRARRGAALSLDLRGEFDGERDRVWDAISRELDEIMGRRGLRWQRPRDPQRRRRCSARRCCRTSCARASCRPSPGGAERPADALQPRRSRRHGDRGHHRRRDAVPPQPRRHQPPPRRGRVGRRRRARHPGALRGRAAPRRRARLRPRPAAPPRPEIRVDAGRCAGWFDESPVVRGRGTRTIAFSDGAAGPAVSASTSASPSARARRSRRPARGCRARRVMIVMSATEAHSSSNWAEALNFWIIPPMPCRSTATRRAARR